MTLTTKLRARLVAVRDYKPGAMEPRQCIFKDDQVGRTAVRRGLLDVEMRNMKLPAMPEPGPVIVCWITDEGRASLE